MLFAVILYCAAVFYDGDNDFVSCGFNCQCAVYGSDIVVAGLGVFVERVAELVLAATDYCLAAGYIVACAFAFCETIAAYGYLSLVSAVPS